MKKMNKLKLGLMALMICGSATALADDSFEWSGYMRTGGAYNSNFQNVAKHDEHHLGRYGNEVDTWLGSMMNKTWENEKGEWAKYHLDFVIWDGDTNKQGTSFVNEQNYLEMGGFDFLPEGSNIWMGTVKMNKDIHILDWKWQQLTGTGFGYVSGPFDFALLSNDSGVDSTDSVMHDSEDVERTTLTARVGMGALNARVIYNRVADYDTNPDDLNEGGVALHVDYSMNSFYGLMDGSSAVYLQTGTGMTSNDLGSTRLSDSEDDTAMRVIADGFLTPSEGLDINPVVVFESTDYDAGETETGLTVAARVSNKITDNISMIYDGSIYNVENSGGDEDADGTKYKFSVGPSLKLDYGYWTRPEMRVFATVIGGDEEIISLNEGEDSEFRVGYQFETWF